MLFKNKPDEEKRSKLMPIRWTVAEREIINEAANARGLTPTEYIRRAALKRKTDIRYEKEIVLALRGVCSEISRLYNDSVAQGLNPDKALLAPVIEQAIAAMLRIEK